MSQPNFFEGDAPPPAPGAESAATPNPDPSPDPNPNPNPNPNPAVEPQLPPSPEQEAPRPPEAQGSATMPATASGPGPSVPPSQAQPAPRPIAPKEYYSISEVCDLTGLKPHVLRYWESQFPVLNPSKNRSGNRVYQRKEIKLVLLVQHLLYKEKYTIEGARQRLEQLRRGGELSQATSAALDSGMRTLLREELQQLLQLLAPGRSG